MSGTYPVQASALRVGGYVVIRGRPCKIIQMTISKTGKHGHAKVHFTAVDIFTNNKCDMLEASTHNVDTPNVSRVEYQLLDIQDDFLSLMLPESGELKEDIKLPNSELGEEIQNTFNDGKELNIIIQSAMGEEQVISYKEARN